MGAWIEIDLEDVTPEARDVAPFMGAWIEIEPINPIYKEYVGRTLYGCVD